MRRNRHGVQKKNVSTFLAYACVVISLIINPIIQDVHNGLEIYINHKKFSDPHIYNRFYTYYKEPKILTQDGAQKNIVFIYAESLERTYFDDDLFPDLMVNLKELESHATSFTNVVQVPNTGWTVAGMTASLCGVPLFASSQGNDFYGMDYFLPSAVCFGDLLKDVGYTLAYMGGADVDFAGKGKLLSNHGFDTVFGLDDIDRSTYNHEDFSAWGIHDDILLDMVFNRFEELSRSQQKFALFTLTLDTHQPEGFIAKTCASLPYKYADGSNEMLNALKCSDHVISQFIKKILASPYADDTIIVLASDHLAMQNTASTLLQKKERKNLFLIIDPSVYEKKRNCHKRVNS